MRILKLCSEDAWLVESEAIDDKFYKVTEVLISLLWIQSVSKIEAYDRTVDSLLE